MRAMPSFSQYCLLLSLATLAIARFPGDIPNLRLVVTDSRLPAPIRQHSAVYDGEDAIYIVGGTNDHFIANNDKVIKYSLDSGAVEVVGTFRNVSNGAAVMHGGDIIYFGGSAPGISWGPTNVSRISTKDASHVIVTDMRTSLTHMAVLWNPDYEIAYLIGGTIPGRYTYDISVYHASTDVLDPRLIAELPGDRSDMTAAWDNSRKLGYVFGGHTGLSGAGKDVMVFNPTTGNVTRLDTPLPEELRKPAAAFADLHDTAYVVDTTIDKLIAFDASTHEHYTVEVEGFERVGTTAMVYVPKYDRLYIIGGNNGTNGGAQDKISYIELGLGATPPPTTTTTERPSPIDCGDGGTKLISDPFCCERFYFCFGGVPTQHECPEGEHFNPRSSECQDAALVGCGIAFTDPQALR